MLEPGASIVAGTVIEGAQQAEDTVVATLIANQKQKQKQKQMI